jgi:uncharacterized protein YeeX (DUF496 family)
MEKILMNINPSLTCPHCAREYKRKGCYDKHVTMCKILATKKSDNEDNPNNISLKEIYTLVSELAFRQKKMEEQITELTKWVDTKRKKVSIIDWLNENIKCNIDYNKWKKSIKVNRNHLEKIFQDDYIEGICSIIKKNLPPEDDTICIKAFDKKENILFIYTDHEWKILSQENFETLIGLLDKLVMKEFVNWQDEIKSKSKNDYFDLFTENVQKVMGSHFKRDRILSTVKKEIYIYLKIELRNIIQLEFN